MKDFRNKVAVVTGAGSGIGRALALALTERGCELALADIHETTLEDTMMAVRAKGGHPSKHVLDVADRDAMYCFADSVVDQHSHVNLVFNNAGVAHAGTVEQASYEDLEWIVGINFWGVVYGTKAFLPHLRASGDGHVVNISSVFGIIAPPAHAGYSVTKFAVRAFTEVLRQELELAGDPVSATCVHPGGIKTNIARDARLAPAFARELGRGLVTRFQDQFFITTPERAAAVILRGVERDQRRVLVGPDAVAIDLIARLWPAAPQHIARAMVRRMGGLGGPTSPPS